MKKQNKERQKRTFRYGERVYSVYGYTKAELIRKETERREALRRGELIVESNMTVSEWAEQFIKAYKENDMKPYVLNNYEYTLKHYVLEQIGSTRMKNVKPIMCQNILNGLSDKSESTIKKVYLQMNEMFKRAVENKLIAENPASSVTKPRGTTKHRRALTVQEEEAFLKAVKKHPHGLLYMLMWGCGCRPSEAEAVCGRDIQLKEDGNLYLHIRGTKTRNSDRYVPIPPAVAEMLPDDPEPFLPLVMTAKGNAISPRRQRGSWSAMERLMNIELGCKSYRNQLIPPYPLADDLCSYCLRHTFCTNLQKRGVDIRIAQKLMGHSDIRMTANIYTHTDLDQISGCYSIIIGEVTNNPIQLEMAQ